MLEGLKDVAVGLVIVASTVAVVVAFACVLALYEYAFAAMLAAILEAVVIGALCVVAIGCCGVVGMGVREMIGEVKR